ncbi:MAG: DinB family protein [Gemmatimonadales bacterium]
MAVLATQLDQVLARLEGIPEVRGDFRYAPGKWSIKEVVGHLADTERVFAYRALRIARGDATPLAGVDDQAYVREMQAGERTLAAFTGEWGDVRRATIPLFHNLPAPAWRRRGVAGDHPISVRALAYIITGHVRHHLEVLDTRYGG